MFDVPDVPAAELSGAVADQETLLLSYLLTFLVVGLYRRTSESVTDDSSSNDE